MAVWITMATRLVPFATAGGNPKKISVGNDSKDPPPATVFINPTAKPTATKSK
tara:strand:- start:1146 stop:1304 length:159 start_codon:yes stop_codon:yes gene_type:complete